LKVKVWDRDKNEAAYLANFLMQQLQSLHQHLQNENNVAVLKKIKQEYESKQQEYLQLADSLKRPQSTSSLNLLPGKMEIIKTRMAALEDQLKQFEKIIGEYQLAVNSDSHVLLIVENARPALAADKPDILSTLLFTLFGALLFSYLLALFIESKKALV
jgi:transcriptional regulator of heat shock response